MTARDWGVGLAASVHPKAGRKGKSLGQVAIKGTVYRPTKTGGLETGGLGTLGTAHHTRRVARLNEGPNGAVAANLPISTP